jgi:zona occludens toxin (predicted ATPase)
MIICFEGTPGSGKSYEAVKKIVDNLKLGRTVYTNIDGFDDPSNRESIKSYCGLDDYELQTRLLFLPYYLIHEFWNHIKTGSLVVLDEVHKYFSSRDWQKSSNQEFANWASTHRHYGFDVVLITQNIGKVDAHVRGLIEWTYRYRKLNMFGSAVKMKYKRESFMGEDISGQPLDRKIYTYNPRIFSCYKSFVSQDTKELGIMKHANILRHPIFLLIPLAFVAALFFLSKSSLATGDLFGSKKKAHSVQGQSKLPVVNYSELRTQPNKSVVVESAPSPNPAQAQQKHDYPPIPLHDAFPLPNASQKNESAPVFMGMSNGKKIYKDKDGRLYAE